MTTVSAGDGPVGFDKVLGLSLDELSPDRVAGSFPVRPELLQPYGILHGGVMCSVVESAASVGGALWFGDRGHVVGVSNHTNFLRAVRAGTLRVEATPVHRGRTSQLWAVRLHDEHDKLVAQGEVRLANVTAEQLPPS
jgi:1,4-dihydroxy-2-naphthoyl-CoA hydrolase